jgi:N-carbamoylputrescine amidase
VELKSITWNYNTMNKVIKIAVVQMNASPAPVEERLARAEGLVIQCAEMGAQLIVLPEVFNTGYEYSDNNYLLAEGLDGPTAAWMTQTASRYHVHLAGSFLRREQSELFNTLLLVAPDGQQWQYDKNYPWMWERAYFRRGTDITVAQTEFGKVGFLICWDVAHPNLWQQYAGKVDLMIVSSCAPRALEVTFVFPDGKLSMSEQRGGLAHYLKRKTDQTFGAYLRRQAACLGVPVAHASSTGIAKSCLPKPKISLVMLSAIFPPLLKYIAQFEHARIESGIFNETYIADKTGNVLQSAQPGAEGFAISEVILPELAPKPRGKQPHFGIPKIMYWLDSITEVMFAAEYRKKTESYFTK